MSTAARILSAPSSDSEWVITSYLAANAIILPMSGNIMVVVLILVITSVWNDYLVGLTFAGRAYDDTALLRLAAAFEATGARRTEPPRTPRLP